MWWFWSHYPSKPTTINFFEDEATEVLNLYAIELIAHNAWAIWRDKTYHPYQWMHDDVTKMTKSAVTRKWWACKHPDPNTLMCLMNYHIYTLPTIALNTVEGQTLTWIVQKQLLYYFPSLLTMIISTKPMYCGDDAKHSTQVIFLGILRWS